MDIMVKRIFFLAAFSAALAAGTGIYAQEAGVSGNPGSAPQDQLRMEMNPASYIGFTLDMVLKQLGPPRSVYAVRGIEVWQDDVVFVYPSIELYFFKDRVWQVCVISAYNIRIGDSAQAVAAAMGEPMQKTEHYSLYRLPSQSWPLMLRVNINSEGKAAALFIYRPDF